MKSLFRTIFSPVLRPLESGESPFVYDRSHRLILIIMGVLFIGLASLVLVLTPSGNYGYLLPIFVFGGGGLLALIVGSLGSDRAVAKIWGSSK